MNSRCICTIIAKNYLAHARVLMDSVAAHHPEARRVVLLIDEPAGCFDPAAERFEVIPLSQLDLPDPRAFCFKYEITELSTAVKPWLLDLLRRQGVGQAIYLDPDIRLTDSLEPVFAAFASARVLLTPHTVIDYPADRLLPDDAMLRRGGIYNLGFLGVRLDEGAEPFLAWLKSKLAEQCVMDLARGFFVDQRFFDVVPLFFPETGILRSPGLNTAYWNIHARRLTRAGDRWLCNGEPLAFFHFSGFSPARPDTLSKHATRENLPDRPDLQPIFAHYASLLRAAGWEACARWPYGHGFFANGEPIEWAIRQHYHDAVALRARRGDPFASQELMDMQRRLQRWRAVRAQLESIARVGRRIRRSVLGL